MWLLFFYAKTYMHMVHYRYNVLCPSLNCIKVIILMKMAHHGSKYSSSAEFLERIHPKWAVISCGEDNSYGHPHSEAVERLEAEDCTIFQTSDSGAILVKTDGQKIDFVCYNSRK